MNQKPQDLRRSAAEKFIESFDQELLRAFQESEAVTPNPGPHRQNKLFLFLLPPKSAKPLAYRIWRLRSLILNNIYTIKTFQLQTTPKNNFP